MAHTEKRQKRPLGIRIIRIVLKTVLFILLFFILVVLAIQTAPVQNFIRGKAVTWLEKKLNTRVALGKIYVGFPKDIVLENIYLEDRSKDTLLSGGKIRIDITLMKLLKGNVEINDVILDDITAKIKRELPDTTFNFQFIVDAFASKEPKTAPVEKDTANHLSVNRITLNKIRLVYKDVITGNDVDGLLDHLETKISLLDLAHQRFDIPSLQISGFTAKVYQSKPLVKSEPAAKDMADAKEPIAMQLNFKEVAVEKINLDYRNDVSAVSLNLGLQKLLVHPTKLDLARRIIDLNDFILQGTTAVMRLGKTEQAKVVVKETKQEVKSQAEAGWQFNVASLRLDSNSLKFDNDNKPAAASGLDYAHLDASKLTLHLDNFYFTADSISGKLKEASLTERSGLDLQSMRTDFVYGKREVLLKDFYIKTPGTELHHDLAIKYASLQSIKNSPSTTIMHIALENSKVQVKDILVFVPALKTQKAFSNPEATLYLTALVDGPLSDIHIGSFKLSGFNDTHVDIAGNIGGMPDAKHLRASLVIHSLQSSKKDLLLFMPASAFPKTVTIPDRFLLTGTIAGSQEDLATKLLLQTNLGILLVTGKATNITNKVSSRYNAVIETQRLELGTILKKKDLLGALSAVFTIKGTGTDKATADATIDGVVRSAVVKQYNYRDLSLKGSIARQQVKLNAAIEDPSIDITIDASADLSHKYPGVHLQTVIDSIKTLPLHLTAQNIIYRGAINADFPMTNPDSLAGSLFITNSLLITDKQRIQMDTIQVIASHSDTGQQINLNSDILYASLSGRYKLTELGKIFQQAIQPYFTVNDSDSIATKDPYDFRFRGLLVNGPMLKVLLPSLVRLDSINLAAHFSNTNGWNASVVAPVIEVGTNKIRGLNIQAGTNKDQLIVNANVDQLTSGKSLALYQTKIDAFIKNDKVDFNLNIKDKAQTEKYNVAGLFEQAQKSSYRISLKPDSLLLNYDKWTVAKDNLIELNKTNILAKNFNLDKGNEHLSINSDSSATGSPLKVTFADFKVETLTGFIQPDSTLIGGVLNGFAVVSNIMKEPVFTSDLTVTDLNIKKDTVGVVKMLVNNKTENTYNADISITGRGNDVHLTGNYYAGQPDNNFDLLLDLKKLPLTTAQAFSQGAIQQASGDLTGQFQVKGNAKAPKIAGNLNFVQAAFKPSQLNNRFVIDNEKIVVDEQGIRFNKFAIKDSANNELTLDGTAATTNFTNYDFDFTIRANNFQALNSTKKDSKLFYGQLYFNSNLTVKGTEKAPVIDGRLTVNEKTRLTIVLPQKEPGVASREGIVEFVDKDAPVNDSLFLKSMDSVNNVGLKGMDLTANIEIKKEAELNLIVDQGSGDFLNVRGEAALTAGVDPSGKVTLAGSYELEDGAYQLTFNVLRRKFNIQKGSKIVWAGEPTQADVNITAAYETSTAPLDLVKNQLGGEITDAERNTYLQKLPFQVYLKMNGKLLQPIITFDIVLPDDKEYNVSPTIVSTVRTKLEILRLEEGELNKQVFALLLLNRFVGENPFNSSGSGATAETLIRQSASKLLTEQLNKLAESLVQGVDLNFDVESSDDYTTGTRKDRTDLNVGLSKKLLNDRLTVTVGSDFELEGVQNSNRSSNNIAGNVALNYRLSKDGRYALRAYRKNEYQGVLDGYIIETGVGFIITVDYNKFRELFHSKKKRQLKKNTEVIKPQPTAAVTPNTPHP